jgi:hypothetical protein
MALTPLGWGISPWTDPLWWAGQQIKVMTATTTYLARVAQAWTGVRVLEAGQDGPRAVMVPATPDDQVPATPDDQVPATPDEILAVVPDEESVAPPEEEPPVVLDEEPAVPRWDELSLGSIRARLARLSEADLAQLRQYEERHGARPDVLSMLANRLIKVRQAG